MMMTMMMMMRIDAQGFEPAERENQAEGHVDGPGSGASRCELCALFDLYNEMVLDEKNTDEKKKIEDGQDKAKRFLTENNIIPAPVI